MQTGHEHLVHASKESPLAKLLHQWVKVHLSAGERLGWRDTLWWCTERTSVGALAVAAWHAGGIAFEEYGEQKAWKKSHYNGRCDLFVLLDSHSMVIEAKQCWPRLGKNANSQHHDVKKSIRKARADARRTEDDSSTAYGAVMISPSFPKREVGEARSQFASWASQLARYNATAYAWVLAPAHYELTDTDTGRAYPGAAILLHKYSRA